MCFTYIEDHECPEVKQKHLVPSSWPSEYPLGQDMNHSGQTEYLQLEDDFVQTDTELYTDTSVQQSYAAV